MPSRIASIASVVERALSVSASWLSTLRTVSAAAAVRPVLMSAMGLPAARARVAAAFDEMNGTDGLTRPAYQELAGWLRQVPADILQQRRREALADLAREGFEGAKYVCSPPMRDPSNRPALWRGLQAGDLQIFGSDHCSFNFAGQKELGRDDFAARERRPDARDDL